MTTPIWNCCCGCNRKLENYANTTDLNSWFHSFPSDSPYYGCYMDGTPQPPRTASDPSCSECTGSCFCGAWPIPYPNQYFTDQNTQSTFNVCTPGYRGAIARRIWNGRYGFTDDYVANPKIETKWLKSIVDVKFEEHINNSTTADNGQTYSSFGNASISGQSSSDVSHNGVNVFNGNYLVSGYDENCSAGVCIYGGDFDLIAGPGSTSDPDVAKAGWASQEVHDKNRGLIDDLCNANCDRSIIRCIIPIMTPQNLDCVNDFSEGGVIQTINFVGTVEQLITLVNSYNNDCSTNDIYGSLVQSVKNSISCNLTNSTLNISISGSFTNVFIPNPEETLVVHNWHHSFDFQLSLQLSTTNVFSDLQNDAHYLLNYWDMANDSIWDYSWMTGNCQILPMVSRREIGATAPAFGYQEAPTDPGEVANLNANLAFYDGSVVGAPLSSYQDPGNPGHDYPNGHYNPGWFDFGCVIYHYNEPIGDSDNFQLCYGYGSYMPSGMPSQATQFPDGATDTCYLGKGWSPFSRFKVSYVLNQMPPFVLGGGAYVSGTNGTDVYASKYAEVKMPLASQNFCAPTSVQPNQAAVDNFAGWPAPNMKDLDILSSTCADTGIKRYPDATDTPDPYWFDIRPKGDFVMAFFNTALSMSQDGGGNWIQNYTTTPSAIERNIQPGDKKYAIIAICPPYSPELTNSNWQGGNVFFWTDYPQVQPLDSWRATIQQAMTDRFWIDAQDNQEQQDLNEGKVDGDGNPLPPDLECVSLKLTTPLVEARLTAPRGAPLQFATASPNRWLAMPTAADFGIACTGVWNYGYAPQPFSKPFGFQSATVTDNAGSNLGAGDSGGGL
jgi:hypothetical protein